MLYCKKKGFSNNSFPSAAPMEELVVGFIRLNNDLQPLSEIEKVWHYVRF